MSERHSYAAEFIDKMEKNIHRNMVLKGTLVCMGSGGGWIG